jgi:hypothetical protein
MAVALAALVACGDEEGVSASGEVCGNARDDDGDGFADCADQDCWRESVCGDVTSDMGDGTTAPETTPPDIASEASDGGGDAETRFDVPLETVSSCDPCGEKGSIKGRVCAPNANVFVNDARVWIEGAGCGGDAFVVETTSAADGTYYLLDVPCGTHTLRIEKGSFAATHPVSVVGGELLDVTGAANKLCFGSGAAKIAVLAGSWDDMGGLLEQLGLRYDLFNDHGDQGADGAIVELLSDPQRLGSYDILFANCGGTVGWLPQDEPAVMPNVKDFVLGGGSLYMSDYAWVLGEWSFPDKVDWYDNDDPTSMGDDDSPQVIPSGTKVTATVADGTLASYLGKDTIAIAFDQGPQIAPVAVANGAFAHVVGNIVVPLQLSIANAPLTLSYVPADGAGRVIYTNFHNDAQTTADMLTILNYLVFTL